MESTPDGTLSLATLRPVDGLRHALRPEAANLAGWAIFCVIFACVSLVGLVLGAYEDWRYSRYAAPREG